MRRTLDIDGDLLARAREITGVRDAARLVHMGLEALVSVTSARRLAALGGTEKKLLRPRRRRSGTA